MNNQGTVSVIIPIFNSERYLPNLLKSVLNQTYRYLEIICIDDGSTDSSYEIIKRASETDSRIILVSQQNQGVSAARNTGLEIATGEFICFIDSDDLVYPWMIDTLVDSTKNSSLAVGKIEFIDLLGNGFDRQLKWQNREFSKEDFEYYLFEEVTFGYLGYLCDKIYRNSIIQENHLRFDSDVLINEDRLFIFQYLQYSRSIFMINKPIYQYRIRNKNELITGCKDPLSKKDLTAIKAFTIMKQISLENNLPVLSLVRRKAFESALDMYKRSIELTHGERKRILLFMQNCLIEIQKDARFTRFEKLKFLIHFILKR